MRETFIALLERHQRLLFKVANAYCADRFAREDLIQEMIVALWRSFDRYDQRRRFSTWAYRIALNVAISFNRGELRRVDRFAERGPFLLEVAAPETGDTDVDLLHRLIERLDDLDRALVLLYLDGLDQAATAEILGISTSNVGTKLHRIKERIRRDVASLRSQENAS